MDSTEARFLELEARLDAMQAQLNACMASPPGKPSTVAVKVESSAAPETTAEEIDGWELDESIWVTPLLMCSEPVGYVASAYLLLLLVGCMAMQAVFLYLLQDEGSGLIERMTDDGTVADLLGWRRTVAHDYKYYNPLQQRSLAQRVCELDDGIELSDGQRALYSELLGYPGEGDGIGASGMIMAALAITAWCLAFGLLGPQGLSYRGIRIMTHHTASHHAKVISKRPGVPP